MPDRPRGVTVQVLDMQPLIDRILDHARENIRPDIHGIEIQGRWAIGTDAGGKKHILCSEGVGWDLDDEPVKAPLFERFADEKRLSMVPLIEANLTTSTVADLPRQDEDLADFVRSFGARLERNFFEWYGILTNTEGDT
jgi:hypothetical protein